MTFLKGQNYRRSLETLDRFTRDSLVSRKRSQSIKPLTNRKVGSSGPSEVYRKTKEHYASIGQAKNQKTEQVQIQLGVENAVLNFAGQH